MGNKLHSKPVISIIYNTTAYVYKFRMNLIQELKNAGFRVVVISPVDEYVPILVAQGVEHYPVTISQYGMNPFRELHTIYQIYTVLKKIKPVCSLHYTVKPNIFGNIAARMAGINVINNIAGAGRAFSDESNFLRNFISFLYKYSLKRAAKVFFQNNDDMKVFLDNKLVEANIVERVPGSGVDLTRYVPKSKNKDTVFKFLFIGRLLKEKGIEELLKAAEKILQHSQDVVFEIVGEFEELPVYINKAILEKYLSNHSIVYHGTVSPDYIPKLIADCDCVVLPSYYREGVPRSLLEAAAMAKPIITTDNVGCQEVVDEGFNGYKVPVKDSHALAAAMLKMLDLPEAKREQMGQNGRAKVEKEFDEAIVINAYLGAIEKIVPEKK